MKRWKEYLGEVLNVKNDNVFDEREEDRRVDAEVIGVDENQIANKKLKW